MTSSSELMKFLVMIDFLTQRKELVANEEIDLEFLIALSVWG